MHTDEGNEHDIEQQPGVKEKETAKHAAKKKTQAAGKPRAGGQAAAPALVDQ